MAIFFMGLGDHEIHEMGGKEEKACGGGAAVSRAVMSLEKERESRSEERVARI